MSKYAVRLNVMRTDNRNLVHEMIEVTHADLRDIGKLKEKIGDALNIIIQQFEQNERVIMGNGPKE